MLDIGFKPCYSTLRWGVRLRRFTRLGGRMYKVIIGLWLRLKYKWLGYN